MLLSLQQPQALYLQLPAIESLQREYAVKLQGEDSIKEGNLDPSDEDDDAQEPPGEGSQGVTWTKQTPFLNPDPLLSLAWSQKCGCKALLDNGMQINTITPNYVKNHLLEMGLITDFIGTRVICMGLGNAYTQTLGYIIVWVQVDGVQAYDENQIALAISDELKFAEWILVLLGTCTISHVMNVMKEREIDALAMPWAKARVAHLLSVHRAAATVMDDQTLESANPNGYDEVVFMRNTETIEAFSSLIISIKAEKP